MDLNSARSPPSNGHNYDGYDDQQAPNSASSSTSTSSTLSSMMGMVGSSTALAASLFPKPDDSGFRTSGFSKKRLSAATPATPMKRNCTPRILRKDDEAAVLRSPFVNIISPRNAAATNSPLGTPQHPPPQDQQQQDQQLQTVPSPTNYFTKNFKIVKLLGSGSFGDVFHVVNGDNEPFAVKCSRTSYKGLKDRQRRLEEVHNLERIVMHPNCVHLVEAWEQKGLLYICTELCPLGSLKAYMDGLRSAGATFTDRAFNNFFVDILLGLEHIHSYKMAHLDLKPENLLLQTSTTLKIGDFGIATQRDEGGQDGDMLYMAPELLHSHYTCAADIFSLGIILLEMLTLQYPPDEGNEWQSLRQGDASIWPGFHEFSPELQALVLGMLNPDPFQRPTASDVLSHRLFSDCLAERRTAGSSSEAIWTNVRGAPTMLSTSSQLSQEVPVDLDRDVDIPVNAPYLFSSSDANYSSPGNDYDNPNHSSPFSTRNPNDFVLTPPSSFTGHGDKAASSPIVSQPTNLFSLGGFDMGMGAPSALNYDDE